MRIDIITPSLEKTKRPSTPRVFNPLLPSESQRQRQDSVSSLSRSDRTASVTDSLTDSNSDSGLDEDSDGSDDESHSESDANDVSAPALRRRAQRQNQLEMRQRQKRERERKDQLKHLKKGVGMSCLQ